jgi:hypothetical protein
VAAFVLVWFAYPPKAVAALNWIGRAANHPLGPQSPGLANALYYPTVALPASAGSWLHVLYLALGFCFSLPYWRERALRVFVGLALLTFVPALWTTNHQMRYILPLLLALDVLAAFWIAVGFERVAALRQRATAAAVAVLVLVLLLGFAVPPERTDLVPAYAPPLDEMLAYFDKQAREVGPVLLLGAPDAGFGADHLFLDWHAIVEARLIPLNGSGVLYSPWTPERAVPVETLRRLGMPPAALDDLAQLQRRGAAPDPPGSSRALWIAIAGDALQPRTPDELRVQLEPTLGVYQPRRVVAVGDQSRVALYTPAFLEAALEGTGYTLVTTREFPEVKVTVLTFDR